MKKILLYALMAAVVLSAGCRNSRDAGRTAENYNYIIGTQTFAPRYKFTDRHALLETADRIREMGSNIIKFSLNPIETETAEEERFRNEPPLAVASQEKNRAALLDMDFKYFMMWVTTPGVQWNDGMTETELSLEYDSMYELSLYLLRHFDGTGKQFYLGHWEGDWLLLDSYAYDQQEIDPVRIKGMTEWYDIRQKAVEDARRDYAGDVGVYHYAEVNRITPSLEKGQDRIVNRVLPQIDVDYVSYSSYEVISEDIPSKGADFNEVKENLFRSLDYIESNMKPRSDIAGKRVFIGEYGYPLELTGTAEEQARRTFHTIRAAMEWGCPFILYWEMYDNEGKGYWMVDSENVEQPVYTEHREYYAAMRNYVRDYAAANKQAPPSGVFRDAALEYLASRNM